MFEFVEFEDFTEFDICAIDMRASACAPRTRSHSGCGYTYIKSVLKTFVVSDAEQLPASVPALLGESHARALMFGRVADELYNPRLTLG